MSGSPERIENRFAALVTEGRAALVTFVMGGDPDMETGAAILEGLSAAGADVIELGMPFTDPMADGPAIQVAGQRALASGATLKKLLAQVAAFRQIDAETPVILMGYYNPIHHMGVDAFIAAALDAGVDGLIIVDLPPEEDGELCLPALAAGLRFIRLATPTTDDARLPAVLAYTSGFVYYVSITGITGAARGKTGAVGEAVARIKRHSALPVVVGFGIKTPEQAAEIAKIADGAVVGSALVSAVAEGLDEQGNAAPGCAARVLDLVAALAQGVRGARKG